jgi:hypothetical protein
MIRHLPDYWLEHPALDYLLIMAVAGIVLGTNPHGLVSATDRPVFYQTLAGVSGGLLAIGSISITVVFTVTPTVRLQMVLDLVGQRLRWLIFSSLSGLVATTAGALGLFALDGSSHSVRILAATSLLAFMAVRFGRLWWLFHQTLKTLVRRTPTIDPSDDWTAPDIGDRDYQLPKIALGQAKSHGEQGSPTEPS